MSTPNFPGRSEIVRGSKQLHGLRCTACDCGMAHTYTSRGARQYRYYVCTRAQKQGWQKCPSPSVSAGEIERFVVDQIQAIGRDPTIIAETLDHARRQTEDRLQQLRRERARHHEALRRGYADLTRLATSSSDDAQLADVHDRIRRAECRVTEIDTELAVLDGDIVGEADVAAALQDFDAVWASLPPRDQIRVVELLVARVSYDGRAGRIAITFRPNGIRTLAAELARREEDAA